MGRNIDWGVGSEGNVEGRVWHLLLKTLWWGNSVGHAVVACIITAVALLLCNCCNKLQVAVDSQLAVLMKEERVEDPRFSD